MLLGEKSKFVIVFYSSTVIDMISIGVPSIEYLDISDKENRIGKDTYKMYFLYRNLGFTYGVNNYNQLNDTAKKIVNNPNLAKTELMQNYLKFFSYDKKHSVPFSSF